MARKKRVKTLSCRFCGDVLENADNRDFLSGWTHSHPSVCPYRQDSMPSLNGVHVGDRWRNLHTKRVCVIEAIKLGGCGTYTDREPVFVLRDEEKESQYNWVSPYPMWSLAEHWESLTRPGEWPVPWTRDRRFGKGSRSALVKWRTPAYRGSKSRRKTKAHAYWHSYHTVDEHSIGWEATNVIWQYDEVAEKEQMELALMEQIQELLASTTEFDDNFREALANLGS